MSCDIDFKKNGFQTAYLNIACPRNTSAWGVIPIPIYFFKNGNGPKILMTAGAHGDELEKGQIKGGTPYETINNRRCITNVS